MMKNIKLIVTDSYFNVFPLLNKNLEGKVNTLDGKNLIFCEEKISLMAERNICSAFGGSFNTDVFSFGNFLRSKKNIERVLSKEGSAMAVKRIIAQTELKCFSASKQNLSKTLFELIIQLKSAKVTPEDIYYSASNVDGILKEKLEDIAVVYEGYERFIKERGFDDQNSILNYLPKIIEEDEEMKDANVFIVGFSSFTEQARRVILALLRRAKSVTAILVGGDNKFLYLNETVDSFRRLCKDNNFSIQEEKIQSNFSKEGKILSENIFNPTPKVKEPIKTDNVFIYSGKTAYEEIQTLAESIKAKVMLGEDRFKDFTIAVPDPIGYKNHICSIFNALEIPFFLDEKIKPTNHPLIKLILSYFDVYRKNFRREELLDFIKNPLFFSDKDFTDRFGDYLIKYNVNFLGIKKPFVLGFDSEEEKQEFNLFREKILSFFNSFNIRLLLEKLSVKESLFAFTKNLLDMGEAEEASVNEQIYEAVIGILDNMDMLLSDVNIDLTERKKVFASGVSALELSIIPQYSDAVFIGGYKETSLAKAKYLFAVGLTIDVPSVSDDVALLNDGDIDRLTSLKLLIEPKIKIVNQRARENLGLALSSFSEKLFLFRPQTDSSGKKKLKSEVFGFTEKLFTLRQYNFNSQYLSFRQGLKNFALACGDFAECKINDFSTPASFYKANEDSYIVKDLLLTANKEISPRLSYGGDKIVKSISSPTAIEEFYKCPYRAFATKVLKLKEEETGKVTAISVGLLMHEIFDAYLKRIDEITDEKSSKEVFNEVSKEVLSKDVYARYLEEDEDMASIERLLDEAEKYCYKTYNQFRNSDFKPRKFEKSVKLELPKNVTIYGKVDRIDEYEDYVRIIDYKTGSIDTSEKSLYLGLKLQLFLYAEAVLKDEINKKLAGVYYSPVSNGYCNFSEEQEYMLEGKTLSEEQAVCAQDKGFATACKSDYFGVEKKGGELKKAISEERFNEYRKYAVLLAEKAVESIADGVIVSSPYFEECKYCAYKGMCDREYFSERKISSVNGDFISEALKGGKDNG